MKNDWRKAEPKDLNTLKVINGRTYRGIAEAITVGPDEYETQVRWHLASRKDKASLCGRRGQMDLKQRISVQVLNGATGEVREVIANVVADDEQGAVNKLFAVARQDDFYYRFLGMDGILTPTSPSAVQVEYQAMKFWARE